MRINNKRLNHAMLATVGSILFMCCNSMAADSGAGESKNASSVSYSTWIKQQGIVIPDPKANPATPGAKVASPASMPYSIEAASKVLEEQQREMVKIEQALNEQRNKIAIMRGGIDYALSLIHI